MTSGAHARTGAAAAVVRLIRRRELTMVATVALFLEYEAVLTRPEHLAKAGITVAEAEIVLDVLAAVAEPVEPHFLWRPRLRDADDDMVLEAAVNGRAESHCNFQCARFRGRRRSIRPRASYPACNSKEDVK